VRELWDAEKVKMKRDAPMRFGIHRMVIGAKQQQIPFGMTTKKC
jgi:hypothetical protein